MKIIILFLYFLCIHSWKPLPMIKKTIVPSKGKIQFVSVKKNNSLFGYYSDSTFKLTEKIGNKFNTKGWTLKFPCDFIQDLDFEQWNGEIHHLVTCYDKKDDLNRVYLNNKRLFYSKTSILQSLLVTSFNSLMSVIICRNGEISIYNQSRSSESNITKESFHFFKTPHTISQVQLNHENLSLYLLDSMGAISTFSLDKFKIVDLYNLKINHPITSFYMDDLNQNLLVSLLNKQIILFRKNETNGQIPIFSKNMNTLALKVFVDNKKMMILCENENVLCLKNNGEPYFELPKIFNRNFFYKWHVFSSTLLVDGNHDGLVIYSITGPKPEKFSYLKYIMDIPVFNSSQLKSNWSHPNSKGF